MAHSQNRYHDHVKTGVYSEYTVVCDCICWLFKTRVFSHKKGTILSASCNEKAWVRTLRKKNEQARRKEEKFNSVSFSTGIITSGVKVSDSKQSETLEKVRLKVAGGGGGIAAVEKLSLVATETQNTSFKGKLNWIITEAEHFRRNERKWEVGNHHYFGKLHSEGCPPSWSHSDD